MEETKKSTSLVNLKRSQCVYQLKTEVYGNFTSYAILVEQQSIASFPVIQFS